MEGMKRKGTRPMDKRGEGPREGRNKKGENEGERWRWMR